LPPSNKQVEALLAPQLPLEGAILAEGGFIDIGKCAATELIYVKMSGGPVPGEWKPVKGDIGSLIRRSAELLALRIAMFDDEAIPYTARVMPYRADIAGDYDHLARVREWSLSGWRDDTE
jgi:ATP-dependent helicase/nuclease subunit B